MLFHRKSVLKSVKKWLRGCEKNMKKILSIIMVLLLVTPMMSLALADEADETEDEETQEEISIMNYKFGAEVRLLQLEKVLTRNIMIGEKIKEIQGLEIEISELEPILTEMNFLKDEIQSANPNSEDAVEQFVDMKNESINLTKEFRVTLHNLLDEETLETLREQMKDFYKEEMQSLREQIRNMIRNFNRNRLHSIYEVIGLVDENLLEQYKDGEVTIGEVKEQLREYFDSLTKEERRELFAELKMNNIRRLIHAKAAFMDANEFAQERKEARWNNRLLRINEIEDPHLRGDMNKRIRGRMEGI